MNFKLSLLHKGLILVSIPLFFELIFVFALISLHAQAEEDAIKAAHSGEINNTINRIVRNVFDISSLNSAELLRVLLSNKYQRTVAEIRTDIQRLIKNVWTNPNQLIVVERSAAAANQANRLFNEISWIYRTGNSYTTEDTLNLKRIQLRGCFKELISPELLSLAMLEKAREKNSLEIQRGFREKIKLLLIGGVIFNCVITIAIALIFSKEIVGRVQILLNNSLKLANDLPLQTPVGGSDEIAELDHSFHKMAFVLQEAKRMKQEVVAMVSHDLKTPLASISTFHEMLENGLFGKLSVRGNELLQAVNSNTKQMLILVNDLLTLEKIQTDYLPLNKKEILLQSIFEQAQKTIIPKAIQKEISLEISETPILLKADRDRLIQVVTNLLANAIKFSNKKGQVKLSAYIESNSIVVQVVDNGRGIPDHLKEKIFERWEQVNSFDSIEQEGSGLGLSICKAIIQKHGGTIQAIDNPNGGSIFVFTLPAEPMSLKT